MNIELTRKVKKIKNEEDREGVLITYDWFLQPKSLDESVYDLHLFCISIVKNIIQNKIKVDQFNFQNYSGIDEINETTLEDLHKIYEKVANEIMQKDKVGAENLIRAYKRQNQ